MENSMDISLKNRNKTTITSVQFCRSIQSDALRHNAAPQASLSITNSRNLLWQVEDGSHIHQVGNAIEPSHPLSSASPPALNFSQYWSLPMSQLFTWGGQNIGASTSSTVLRMNIQGWFPLGLTDLISLVSKGLSRVLSSTTIQKHQFLSVQSNSHIHTWLLERP